MILRKQKARDFQLRNSSFLISPLSLIIFQQVVDHEYESHVNSSLGAYLSDNISYNQTNLYLPKDRFHINLTFSENLSTIEDKSA